MFNQKHFSKLPFPKLFAYLKVAFFDIYLYVFRAWYSFCIAHVLIVIDWWIIIWWVTASWIIVCGIVIGIWLFWESCTRNIIAAWWIVAAQVIRRIIIISSCSIATIFSSVIFPQIILKLIIAGNIIFSAATILVVRAASVTVWRITGGYTVFVIKRIVRFVGTDLIISIKAAIEIISFLKVINCVIIKYQTAFKIGCVWCRYQFTIRIGKSLFLFLFDCGWW